jgi:hypothetical protein
VSSEVGVGPNFGEAWRTADKAEEIVGRGQLREYPYAAIGKNPSYTSMLLHSQRVSVHAAAS